MLTREEATRAAMRASEAAWKGWPNRGGTWLQEVAPDMGVVALAQFVETQKGAPAEALYRFAVGADIDARPWPKAAPQLRVAIEVFRASYLALLHLIAADTPSAPRAVIGAGLSKRGFDRMPSLSTRTVMTEEQQRDAEASDDAGTLRAGVVAPLAPQTAADQGPDAGRKAPRHRGSDADARRN